MGWCVSVFIGKFAMSSLVDIYMKHHGMCICVGCFFLGRYMIRVLSNLNFHHVAIKNL